MRHRIGHASSLVEETGCGADADGGRVPLKATGRVELLADGSRHSSGLFVGERLVPLAGPRFRAGQDLRWLVGQGEGELVAIGGSRGVVGLEFGGFALEGGEQGGETPATTS